MAHEFVILDFLVWPCVKRHFGPGILEQWEGLWSGIFGRELTGQENAHLYQVFAMSPADGVVVATDRSTNREDCGPRGLKCCKIRGLETRNPASFQSRLFECSLAREKHTKLQGSQDFGDLAFPPNLAILDRARIRDDLPRENGQSPVLFFKTKGHENRSA